MGSSIIDGILSNQIMNKSDIFIIEPNLKKRRFLNKNGLSVFSNISELEIKKLGIKALLIAVKPQIVKEVAYEIKDYKSIYKDPKNTINFNLHFTIQ